MCSVALRKCSLFHLPLQLQGPEVWQYISWGPGAMARLDSKCEAYECVGVDVGWKRWRREVENGMVLEASCDPL